MVPARFSRMKWAQQNHRSLSLILRSVAADGRAQRVLILMPDSLVHQWFDWNCCAASIFFTSSTKNVDAIRNGQCGNQSLPRRSTGTYVALACSPKASGVSRRRWRPAGICFVVDEAHHLSWTPEAVSPEYALVEALGRQTPGCCSRRQLRATRWPVISRACACADPDRFTIST